MEKQTLHDIFESGVDLEARRIYVVGSITETMGKKFHIALHQLARTPPSRPDLVDVFINSEGGDESAGLAMYEHLRGYSSEFATRTMGIGSVMSAAALLFQAGTQRILSPEARLMIHAGSYHFHGREVQQMHAVALAKEMEVATRRYAALLSERSTLNPDQVWNMLQEDRYMDAHEAVQLGFADAILNLYPPYSPREKAV